MIIWTFLLTNHCIFHKLKKGKKNHLNNKNALVTAYIHCLAILDTLCTPLFLKCSCAIALCSFIATRHSRRRSFEQVERFILFLKTFIAARLCCTRSNDLCLNSALYCVMSDFAADSFTNPQKKNKMEDSKYLPELLAEKDSLDSSFTHAMKLISAEIDRIQKGEVKKDSEKEAYLDIFATKNQKLKERVLIPVKQFPRVNFVGKLLGPGGSTIKRLQEETGAKISVLGKGSMKDKNKEEELRKGGEAKYAHLGMELHVFIEVHAPIPESYLRMAHAMDEVKKFLTPEPGEDEPYMDPHYLNGSQDGSGRGRGMGRGRGGPPGPRGRGMPRGAPRGAMRGARGAGGRGGSSRGAGAGRGAAGGRGAGGNRGGAAGRSRPPASGAPRMLPAAALSHQGPAAGSQGKGEGYDDYAGYDESYADASYEGYDYYSQQAAPTDTEYYDYGHGDAQDTAYDSYTQDDWEGSWSSAGAGGKAPPARQSKGAYREHPYGRY